MVAEITTTIELNPELTNLASEIGLNVQKICENALKLAIGRLQGLNQNIRLVDGAGFEPATSTMPTWRSYQADLPAHRVELLNLYPAGLGYKHFFAGNQFGQAPLCGRRGRFWQNISF